MQMTPLQGKARTALRLRLRLRHGLQTGAKLLRRREARIHLKIGARLKSMGRITKEAVKMRKRVRTKWVRRKRVSRKKVRRKRVRRKRVSRKRTRGKRTRGKRTRGKRAPVEGGGGILGDTNSVCLKGTPLFLTQAHPAHGLLISEGWKGRAGKGKPCRYLNLYQLPYHMGVLYHKLPASG
jgi:hypothetical protein